MVTQTRKRTHVMGLRLTIRAMLADMLSAGISGTSGTRKSSVSVLCWCAVINSNAAIK